MDDINAILPWITAGIAVLSGITAAIAVYYQRKSAKEDTGVKHADAVFGGYGELVDRLETRLESVSVTVERQGKTISEQGNEITSLKIELRDRDDNIKLLTLDRDDLIEMVVANDLRQPPLRTV